jgi:hypothetical protein
VAKKHTAQQLDLLGWTAPTPVAPVFAAASVAAETFREQIARAVAETLRVCPLKREEIARRMADFLGEKVQPGMLDTYASQARDDHTISALRAVALMYATGDVRLLQLLAEPLEHVVIDRQYLPALKAEILRDRIEELRREEEIARRAWRAPRR